MPPFQSGSYNFQQEGVFSGELRNSRLIALLLGTPTCDRNGDKAELIWYAGIAGEYNLSREVYNLLRASMTKQFCLR